MPIQVPQWNEYLTCPICFREYNRSPRSPINLGCGHTLCKVCLTRLNPKQCPFDQTAVTLDADNLVINTALLQLCGIQICDKPYHPPIVQALSEADRAHYDLITRNVEELAKYLKYNGNGCKLSKPMQRKLVNLIQCTVLEEDGRGRTYRAVRSLAERTVTEIILQHQNPQQLGANLWAAVRARGCQFLGPAMQEEVLKLVLLALEDGSALSRKVLVMFVVQRLEIRFPQASKTSIGHVVQLLYRASCFKVSKRESDSSLMQLKEEFRTYDNLRREHDSQIVQIATEAGLRIAPDQWSSLLYGDPSHKSHMQSIIDRLQTPQSFVQSVQDLMISYQRSGDPGRAEILNPRLQVLTVIDSNPDSPPPSWAELANALCSVRVVVSELVQCIFHQTSLNKDINQNPHNIHIKPPNLQAAPPPPATSPVEHSIPPTIYIPGYPQMPKNYKVAMCNLIAQGKICFRGDACYFAHNEEEMVLYRAKNRRKNNTHPSTTSKPTFSNSADYQNSYQFAPKPPSNGNVGIHKPNIPVTTFPKEPYQPHRYPGPNFPVQNNYQVPVVNNVQANVRAPQVPQAPRACSSPKPSTSYGPGASSHVLVLTENENGFVPNRRVTSEDLESRSTVIDLGAILGQDFHGLDRFNRNKYSVQTSSGDNNNGPLLVTSSQRDMFVRSDSILTDDSDYIPFEPQTTNSFGPISRGERGINRVASGSPQWYSSYNVNQQLPIYGAFNTISHSQIHNMDKDIKYLEKLHLDRSMEQDFHDHVAVADISGVYRLPPSPPLNTSGNNESVESETESTTQSEEDTYEVGLAKDIKELELKWKSELEEVEKKWPKEDDAK